MPDEPKEPQSYGSQADWTTGRTGETVNDQKSTPPPQHAEFYDERRESDENAPHQGGHVSPYQAAENETVNVGRARKEEGTNPTQKVTGTESGAKRDSYFRDRDYK